MISEEKKKKNVINDITHTHTLFVYRSFPLIERMIKHQPQLYVSNGKIRRGYIDFFVYIRGFCCIGHELRTHLHSQILGWLENESDHNFKRANRFTTHSNTACKQLQYYNNNDNNHFLKYLWRKKNNVSNNSKNKNLNESNNIYVDIIDSKNNTTTGKWYNPYVYE